MFLAFGIINGKKILHVHMVSGILGKIIADYSILLHYLFINLPTDRNNPFICVNKDISKKMFVYHLNIILGLKAAKLYNNSCGKIG
jgi:hypothetical protein